ncbi:MULTISPECIES: dihydroxyacetone kinase subunit DhaK [Enterobacter]|jgi:dihydroxyacetone kinase|uniref:dihydroxyacetone kinase subunit DhaK n=1 Tax=Enterobacter TaxID=547 RepID=UPI0006819BD2|nr:MULTISPECIES: dihydroxyacetone kinase subunit DhaK [Enterobacter]EKS7213975.1 dihydroxyacetone kinase subunit DhaK [Enterobacter ludwigii]ELP5694580.1 dihydroxyacetone kinase subunit DhaK [Enterobacter ludwigii]EMD2745404.1 dihydroxyacetone kinase subunit DhaK [Enterobacter ludwigii]MBO1470745.1 dihydroxyacetone kinase subunit DhaK [Enterobacter ludwigii]MBO1528899.1 dihydroxyacetone kinase subunit DhaK [Enterobacter ludwigii]
MSRFFFNDRKQLVNDAIEGILISAPHANLVKLDIDPAIRVVARSDWDKSRVAVISGGGSGHEPAHAGFVGKGMLTAAVCGDLFASPSVDAVLNAIVAVTGDRGCLLIVKNYTGDRLNFGLAAEKAKRYGLKVEMVIVADDIALPDNKQPRGIAGTALVHKIAGYAAEHGKSLTEVRDIAQQACDNLWSLGVAMQTCNLPGSDDEEGRIRQGHVELGLGIHGEPGASVVDTQNSKAIIDTLVEPLKAQAGNGRFAVLINNLGGVSALEMALLTKELAHSALKENIAYLIGPAPLVSALDMKGFSLTLLKLNDLFEKALHEEVETLGWQKPVAFAPLRVQEHSAIHDRVEYTASDNPRVAEIVSTVTQTLIQLENRLNALDAKVGDGDTGSTFAQGARDIAQRLEKKQLPLNDVSTLLLLVGERLATVMGGSSGVLMSIFFTAAGQTLHDGQPLPEALLSGLAQMKQYGGADLGDRTLIDALQPALEALQKGDLQAAAQAANAGAEATANMVKAGAGRSSYVNKENLEGVTDPGAVAVAEVFKAMTAAKR